MFNACLQTITLVPIYNRLFITGGLLLTTRNPNIEIADFCITMLVSIQQNRTYIPKKSIPQTIIAIFKRNGMNYKA